MPREQLFFDTTLEPTSDHMRYLLWINSCSLLRVLQHGPDRLAEDFNRFTAGYERRVHDCAIRVLLDMPFDSESRVALLHAASNLAVRIGVPLHPLAADFTRIPNAYEDLDVGEGVYVYIREYRQARSCSGPRCDNYLRDDMSNGRSLLRCGGCRFVRYCSLQCQRLDWPVGRDGVSHKAICGAVRRMLPYASRGMDAFADAYNGDLVLSCSQFGLLAKRAATSDILASGFTADALRVINDAVGLDDPSA
ncbi:hypothetical protein AURDEDRAFT_161743 [Auricularia subglabra TFB-10046 SS5]|nr:hypothetical protein AURDEDRAFT_161743 [Auricularia subglabra TFB-10046 SS5]